MFRKHFSLFILLIAAAAGDSHSWIQLLLESPVCSDWSTDDKFQYDTTKGSCEQMLLQLTTTL